MEKYSSMSVEELAHRCCGSGELEAWEEFVRRFHRLIAKVVLRVAARWGGTSKETIDDLIQETYLKFCADNCRIFSDFDHRHPDAFVGYVQVVAANVARDYFKTQNSQRRGRNQVEGISDDLVPAAIEGSAGSPKAIERFVLIQEIQRQLDICVVGSDQDRNTRIFWLYYRAGLSAAAIAALPGIGLTTKGVESLIQRLSRDIKERLTAQENPLLKGLRGSAEGILSAESL